MSDSLPFSVFYQGGPLDGKCFIRSFREALQAGQTLRQILSIESSSHRKWIETGNSGPTVVRAEYEITHINGFVAVARFIGIDASRFA